MTTIAYDGNIVAVDSQINAGNTIVKFKNKMVKVSEGKYLAICGVIEQGLMVAAWLKEGGEKPKVDNFSGMYIEHSNVYEINEGLFLEDVTGEQCVIGSGSACALIAMDCGKTAIEAVECAVMRDVWTGGQINFVDTSLNK